MNTKIIGDWHEDFSLDELDGEALRVATALRDYLDSQYTLRDREVEMDGEVFTLDNCSSGCKLFHKEFSYVYSTNNYQTGGVDYHTKKVKGALFHLVFDGGLLYDVLSPNGDGQLFYGMDAITPIEEILKEYGCELEPTTSYCYTIWKEESE